MANYKPVTQVIQYSTIYNKNGAKLSKDIATTSWNLALIYGTAYGTSVKMSNSETGAVYISNRVVLKSGTVLGWYSTRTSYYPSNSDFETFSDSYGRYAVTVKTTKPIQIRFYSE